MPRVSAPAELSPSDDVVRAILARREGLRAGHSRDDGHRLGIVVEGGAMRGAVSGGALVGLEEAGLGEVFDVAYGASAGAINLAYFVTGQAGQASRIYLEIAASRQFVNPLRPSRLIDLDWLFDSVIRERYPIDAARLRAAATELQVSVTDALTGRNELLSTRREDVDPIDALKASSAVPFYYGRTVRVGGGDYLDGMASNALPVMEALEECTHVLVVLSSRPWDGSAREPRLGGHDIPWPERLMLLKHSAGFRRSYLTRRRRLRRALAAASDHPRVHSLHPSPTCPVPSRISRDVRRIEKALQAARARALAQFPP